MDTSISKALVMAASILLAIIVVGFIRISMNRMSSWEMSRNDDQTTIQADKFNKEFEVYDKKLMYGVDVISCLNKVRSNNERIFNGAVVNGDKYDLSYGVNVKVTFNGKLKETLTVYHAVSGGNQDAAYKGTDTPQKLSASGSYSNLTFQDIGFEFTTTGTFNYKNNILNFASTGDAKSEEKESKITQNTLILTPIETPAAGSNEAITRSLLDVAGELTKIKNNPNRTEANDPKCWSKAVFQTALYDLKQRKFQCTNLHYNPDTGRVDQLEFVER